MALVRRMPMKALAVLALVALGSPAFAQAPATSQNVPAQDSKRDQKPFVYDSAVGPGGFSAPSPVIIGSSPLQERAPVRPITPKPPASDTKSAPTPASEKT